MALSNRGFKKLHMKMVTTEFGRKSTSFRGAQEWNQVTTTIRNMGNINTFGSYLKDLY